jgi:hypothetical protein
VASGAARPRAVVGCKDYLRSAAPLGGPPQQSPTGDSETFTSPPVWDGHRLIVNVVNEKPCRLEFCALQPHRMMSGTSAVGERCWHLWQWTHSHGVTRRRYRRGWRRWWWPSGSSAKHRAIRTARKARGLVAQPGVYRYIVRPCQSSVSSRPAAPSPPRQCPPVTASTATECRPNKVGSRVVLFSRNGHDFTDRFPSIAQLLHLAPQ